MMIRVPATSPPGISGLGRRGIPSSLLGLGDDGDGTTDTAIYDTPPPVTTPITILDTSSNPLYSDIVTPSDYSSATGPIDQSGTAVTPIALSSSEIAAINALPTSSVIQPSALPSVGQLASVIQSGTSSGLNANQIAQIFSSASAAGLAIFKATSSPSLIPGTNLVYNPATGQVSNATTGLTGSQLASTLGLSPQLLLLLGAGLLAVMLLEGRK
jgi:hypothetical protein